MTEEAKKEDELEIDLGKAFSFFKKKEEHATPEHHEEKSSEGEELELDLSKAFSWIKSHKTIVVWALLLLILAMAFYSRSQDIPLLQNKYLVSPDDPYFFMRMTNYVADTGKLPENDTMRYYPVGYKTSSENLGMIYLAGYTLKFIRTFNPDANAVTMAAWLPPILLVIALLAFFFLVKELFERDDIALIATGFLAFSVAIFFRTMSGFLEKEPLFFPFMALSFYFFIKGYKQKEGTLLYILPILAGIATGFSGFASGLFVFTTIYIAIFAIAEVILEKMNKKKFTVLALWFVFTFITLTALTTKYGTFDIWKSQAFQIPAVGLLFAAMGAFVPQLKQKILPKGVFHIILGTLIIIMIGIVVFGPSGFSQMVGFYTSKIINPAGTDRFVLSVSENQPPVFIGGGRGWWATFGVSFVIPFTTNVVTVGVHFLLFFLGSVVLFYNEFKNFKYKWWLTGAFLLFMCSLIFENVTGDQSYKWVSAILGHQLLYTALFGAVLIVFLFLEHEKKEHLEKINSVVLFMLIWFVVATVAANGAIRLFFILAMPLMIIAAYTIPWLAEKLKTFTNQDWMFYLPYLLAAGVIISTFAAVTEANAGSNPSYLGVWYDATDWIKANTPTNAVFTHWWDYGYFIQTMGERATTVDPGNFIVGRDYDIGAYIFNSYNNSEVLDYLHKYGNPDYLFIISEDVFKFFQIANLGSLSEMEGKLPAGKTLGREAYFSTYVLKSEKNVIPNNLGNATTYPLLALLEPTAGPAQVLTDFRLGDTIYPGEATFILRYIIPLTENGTYGRPSVQIYNQITQKTEIYPIGCYCQKNKGCFDLNLSGVPVCYLSYRGGILNIPYKAKDILFTNLYILEKDVPGFDKVYENNIPLDLNAIHGMGTNIKIYKYNYTELEKYPNR